ncbi:hypothetical protein EXIGLDRAFT_755939 [Exidia glandulosa HHB12029]|uniref:Uncharacterized protein n=1 Tax=Exidia glandulosa HHB12029 TaxID=1314781 RepID=A0A165ZAP3_EXIGL|nr:hypothetical protein EXIGLDRAFT_755939 [Exidia glandulosa HHB12029]
MAIADESLVGEVEGSTTEEDTFQLVAKQFSKYSKAALNCDQPEGTRSRQQSPSAVVEEKLDKLFKEWRDNRWALEWVHPPRRSEDESQKTALPARH